MARTVNLNLTGAAARTALREQREALLDEQRKQARIERQRKEALVQSMMLQLDELEGDAFVTWWDEELPPIIPINEQLRLLEQRLRKVVLSRIQTTQEGAQDNE